MERRPDQKRAAPFSCSARSRSRCSACGTSVSDELPSQRSVRAIRIVAQIPRGHRPGFALLAPALPGLHEPAFCLATKAAIGLLSQVDLEPLGSLHEVALLIEGEKTQTVRGPSAAW